jgi:hypothetical protein
VQLTIGFIVVLDLAAQLVEGAGQFAGRVVLVTAIFPLIPLASALRTFFL